MKSKSLQVKNICRRIFIGILCLCLQENERSDLLDQYRVLSMEAEQYQTSSHQLESEGSNLRLEIMTKDSELRRLRDKNDNLEREISEVCP